MKRKIRILMAKSGLDGHDRGAKVIAMTFRDAGFEVIYTGLHARPREIVNAAVQEGVDLIALSVLSGAHLSICQNVLTALEEADARDIEVIIGGTILEEDVTRLKAMGVGAVFPAGSPLDAGVKYIESRFGLKDNRT